MIKLLWRFLLLVLAAIAFAWLADRPEKIVIQSPLHEIQVSLLVGVVLLSLVLGAAYFIWKLVHRIWSSPKVVRESMRFRKHRKAYESLSRGIIAAGAGDAVRFGGCAPGNDAVGAKPGRVRVERRGPGRQPRIVG